MDFEKHTENVADSTRPDWRHIVVKVPFFLLLFLIFRRLYAHSGLSSRGVIGRTVLFSAAYLHCRVLKTCYSLRPGQRTGTFFFNAILVRLVRWISFFFFAKWYDLILANGGTWGAKDR